MNSSFFNFRMFFIFILFILFIIFFTSTSFFLSSNDSFSDSNYSFNLNYSISSDFAWPVPGFTRITSTYGPRNRPTSGASSFHYGIDIGAPSGSNLISAINGKVIYTDFNRCKWI